MFGLFTNTIENVLDVGESLLTGELPTKRQVAQLLDTGLTVTIVASLFGASEEIITKIIEGDS